MKSIPALAAVLLILALVSNGPAVAQTTRPAEAGRQVLSLDRGWLFHLGDIPFPVVSGQGMSYGNAKAGNAGGAAAADYDDSDWRSLDLPHDWAVEGPFDPKANLSQGFRPRGFAWYRRHFKLDPADRGRHLEVQFDGVSTYCTVWVNGIVAARNWCGYTSFYIDITPFARYGGDVNTIAVRVDAESQEGWWYEGAGIYRHTALVKRSPVHVITDGVFAQPVRQADATWAIPAEVTLTNSGKATEKVDVEMTLRDPGGVAVASVTTGVVAVEPFVETTVKPRVTVESPHLWSIEDPALYQVETVVKRDGAVIDRQVTTCGFRTIRFDPSKGFFLNDEHVKLQGVCNHQDHAGVGVAVPDSLWEFRLRRLKEMGVNAYRCAHNPPAKEFLDACDRAGILVMDENRNFNTTDEYLRQLRWMVRRDRNHPSVILWSVFNEEPTQGSEVGYEMVRRLSAEVKTLDSTRFVTAAQSGAMLNDVNASLAADVAGFNYQHGAYDRYHALHPDKPVTSSEDTSAVMTRGEYVTDKKRFVLDSYDTQFQPWGRTHHEGWQWIADRPFVAGGFVWTGFDYRGEPQPLEWPAGGSSFGIMDLCGFPKSAFYLHQAKWLPDQPVLHLIPHWNWAGSEGKPIKVMAFTNGERVALTLNGKPIGTKAVDEYGMVSWDVPFEAGKLEAVSTRDGQETARFAVETTGAPVAIEMAPDRKTLAGDGRDALPVTVRVVDAQGRAVPTADLPVKFEVSGPGSIIGLGNGDPLCHEPEKGDRRSLYNGLAQVIVQSAWNSSGTLTLRATADGLKAAEIALPVQAVPPIAEAPGGRAPFVIGRWRMSPVTADKPDPNQKIGRNDMNTWTNVRPGNPQTFGTAGYAIFRATFTPRASVRRAGGRVVLHDVVGPAQVWLDEKRVAEKPTADRGDLVVDLPPGDGERTMNLIINAAAGAKAGLGGNVTVEPISPQ